MAPDESPKLAVDVEKYRIAAGLSHSQLSDVTGISPTTLRRSINYPGLMTFDQAKAIAHALGIPAGSWTVA